MSKCKPCMSPGIKDTIREYDNSPEVQKQLNRIPDCTGDEVLNVCECSEGGKRKREPSAYNNFIKSCFQEKPNPTLKDCAADWRKKKTEG